MPDSSTELKRILTPVMVWGLGVGYVISGNYFGWNLGLVEGGTFGLAIATGIAIAMYITFTFSYAELACALPGAGGAFDYARRALGNDLGFMVGMFQNIEFIFAPPAIAFAIGSYMNLFVPSIPAMVFSVCAYMIFTGVNIYGIKTAASVELLVTGVAVVGLIIFAATMLPHVRIDHLTSNPLPQGLGGIFAAAPFAIWFFLGIEGVANLAEEAINPRQTMSKGFLMTLFTLISVCLLTFVSSVGVGGWEKIVFGSDGKISDSPLPLAMIQVAGKDGIFYKLLIIFGLFGLVASFNGLMLAAGRSSFEFGRQMLKSKFLGRIHPRFQTPVNALLVNTAIGLVALWTGKTSDVITISVFGALSLYGVSMIALVRLRKQEPNLERPFVTPCYPWFPIIAGVIALLAWISVAAYNLMLAALFVMIIVVCYGIFKFQRLHKTDNAS